ncbi:uncharacterized protein UV8b_00950 [Ustilaginoidea virens]|uniref:Thermotolerance protein n=1 Tax=Ustilaginoidea virens TaxID=1159556 RepID=A0A8E5HKM2_USTVR|nr:uncharacterized protein UV8b_00950 [Ustilaginoidea virens]QUC16709.1 hypothetical protein UV8b_00950 [Ustilaginoidea virens]
MAFQTSIFRDGEWVTETVNLQAAIKASATQKPATLAHFVNPPVCGILSRTIVESPIVHWILPVRLRSEDYNDIAFIGDHFVQISELRGDGQVHEVARKSDFGSRIRGAVVLGDSFQHGLADDDQANVSKSEDQDTLMPDVLDADCSPRSRTLPPQLLVLMLESGDIVYIFLRSGQDSSYDFVLNRHRSPKNFSCLGFHLSVDPSSRYMAAASPEGLLVVYEFHSMKTINEQYRSRGLFDPVTSFRIRAVQGVVQKLEFLYPRPEDDYHIILLLIITRKERSSAEPVSRMVTYEWEVGDSLKDVFAEEKAGNRLPTEHRMPSLLIPLRFNTAFFVVSQPDIGVVKNCLSGSPVFEALKTDTPGRTPLHHGIEKPLWTAWSRPFRRKKYFEKTDIIFLAREDGAIIHIEIDAPELVPSVTNVGCLHTNIDTAFTTAYDVFTDMLIIGGDSGSGGIWKLAPRTDLEQVSVLPNWSPVMDVAISTQHSTLEPKDARDSRWSEDDSFLSRPDSLFSASGRGLKGNLTQWRWGIQGRIGLDIEYGEPIRNSWGFYLETGGSKSLYGLLSLPDSSIVLQFSADFSQVHSVEPDNTGFDLAFRTLHAGQTQSGTIIQVTESSISLISSSEVSHQPLESILGVRGVNAEHAFCGDHVIALSTHDSVKFQLHTVRIKNMNATLISSWDVVGEVTCVLFFSAIGDEFVAVGSAADGVSWISIYSLNGKVVVTKALQRTDPSPSQGSEMLSYTHHFEPLTSICMIHEGASSADFSAGTRCGHLLTLRISFGKSTSVAWSREVMGVAPVDVYPTHGPFADGAAALACCDSNLVMMSRYSETDFRFATKSFVWLTDSNDASIPSPPVHSAFSLGNKLSADPSHLSLMLLVGTRVLLADIWPHYSLVPRCLPLNGTPTRIIYSQAWNCLIVALLQDDRPTLLFVDPETGAQIASASDKDQNPLEVISGLGHAGDRIYGLNEWLYLKDGKTFAFLLVGTKEGRLLIVSVKKIEPSLRNSTGESLQYWTRNKQMFGKPVYSVVGDDDGIIFCVDKTIHWNVLDLAEKKLKQVKQYELDSPATSLRVSNGKILALTTMHSLEVIDHRTGEGNGMALVHTDRVSRTTIHMADIGPTRQDGSGDGWRITLLADQRCGFAGVWVPWGYRNKEFETVFEGALPASIRRFVTARSSPPWASSEPRSRYGLLPSGQDGAEMFGLSLDGSLRHFTLLDIPLWRLLSLVQSLAQRNATLNHMRGNSDSETMNSDDGVELEPRLHPKLMHINGDILSDCLKPRMLEKMVGKADGLDLFCEYLDGLEGGRWTDEFRDSIGHSDDKRQAAYFKLGYEILTYVLAPVW